MGKTEKREKRLSHLDEYPIERLTTRVHTPRFDWLFDTVETLGGLPFTEYVASAGREVQEKPWKPVLLDRARVLSHVATVCRVQGGNELTWRMKIEPIAFARFDIEVAW